MQDLDFNKKSLNNSQFKIPTIVGGINNNMNIQIRPLTSDNASKKTNFNLHQSCNSSINDSNCCNISYNQIHINTGSQDATLSCTGGRGNGPIFNNENKNDNILYQTTNGFGTHNVKQGTS